MDPYKKGKKTFDNTIKIKTNELKALSFVVLAAIEKAIY
jgi:hypothetical protein